MWGWACCVVLLSVWGCGPQGDADDVTRTDTIIVAVQGDAMSLDPHMVTDAASMRMIEPMYSTLLGYGPDTDSMQIVPDLASSVEVSDDGLTWTINLRAEATFHSGEPVTAEDVKASLDRIRDHGRRGRQFEHVTEIGVVDPHTVQLQLDEPFAPLRTYLAHPMNAVVEKRLLDESSGDLLTVDAGCGPYQLVSWQRGQQMTLKAHPGYHHPGQPATPNLILRPIPDATARSTALRTGEVDLIHEVPPKHRKLLEDAAGLTLRSVPGTFWEYIGLNTKAPPLDDPRVRQAIAWAIDRDQMNRAIKFGYATPLTGGLIPPNHWAFADLGTYPDRDLDRAEELLTAAGYLDGFTVEMVVDANQADQVAAAEMVKQYLRPLGIRLDLQALEPTVFYSRLNAHEFEATVVGWMGFVDPDQYLTDIFRSTGAYNQQQYNNAEVDRLIAEGATVVERDQRRPIYTEAQRLIAEDAPMVFLYMNPHTSAWTDHLHGYRVHPTGSMLFLREATLSNGGGS